MSTGLSDYRGRGVGAVKKVILSSMAVSLIAVTALPAQATAQVAPPGDSVQEGRTIEAFIGTNLVNVQNYPALTNVKVEVVRNGFVIGSRTMQTDADGFLEINHAGGTDCFDGSSTPDILPGDVIRTTTEGDAEGVTDSAAVRNVGVNFETINTDVRSGTITISGHARSLRNAALTPGQDILELRLNKGSADRWDVFPGSDQDRPNRRDLRADVGAEVRPNGNWTKTLNVGTQDARDWRNNPGETSLEWSAAPAGAEEVDPPAIFVADEAGGEAIDCPPVAEYKITGTSSKVINARTVGKDLIVRGVSFDADGVSVRVLGGASHAAAISPVNAAEPESFQTWRATIPAAELAALPEGAFAVRASYEGDGAPRPTTLRLQKDTIAPRSPVANPQPGVYARAQSVTLKAQPATSIHYTVNGTRPNVNSRVFVRPIRVSATQTIKAIAVDEAGNASPVAGFRYVIR